MEVVWNGRRDHPAGRQFFVPEWPAQAPPPLTIQPRAKIQVFHRSQSMRVRVFAALQAESLTGPEIATRLDAEVEAVRHALHKLRQEGRIQVVGLREVTPSQKYDRTQERVYAPIGRDA
jgi:hypothetical protein